MSTNSALRAEYPWMDHGETIYLNAASTGPYPARAVEAQRAWAVLRGEPHRIRIPDMIAAAQDARTLFAAQIGADVDEIALMPNTTYGLNLAARGLPLRPGTILTVDGEFPSCVYPFMALSARGMSLERVPMTAERLPDEEELIARIARPDVVAVVISWVQYASGYVMDLPRISAACKAAQVFLIVDGIQGCGVRPIDVHAVGIDLFASGAQKWMLGPWGTGFVYVRRALHDVVRPHDVGWACMTSSVDYAHLTQYDDTFLPDARRYEVVTLAYHDFAVAAESLRAMQAMGGAEQMAATIAPLVDRLSSWAASRADVVQWTPRDPSKRAGVFSFSGAQHTRWVKRLQEHGVVFVEREGAIRLAPHAYNTIEEIERVIRLLDRP